MVLKRIFKGRPKRAPERKLPKGQRVYAVGDVHGRLDLLEQLLDAIRDDDKQRGAANTRLIFLGDLVDRGPDSNRVIERLIQLRDSGADVSFLLGNHDEIFLKAVSGDIKAARMLTRIGGKETILSYGISPEEYRTYDFAQLVEVLAALVPPHHTQFIASFEDYVEIGDYLFVHAGIRPGLSLADQTPTDLRWIRKEFLESKVEHCKIVVHGHSISDEVDMRPNRIGIDTGAFASGRLTAIGLENQDIWFLAANGNADRSWGRITD